MAKAAVPVATFKAQLRRQIRARLGRMSGQQRESASAQARARLVSERLWQRAELILFFAPLPDELDVWPLLAQALAAGKRAALPRFAAERNEYEVCGIEQPAQDVIPGRFGILEPTAECASLATKRLDLILVPGLGFDLRGGRLGRGFGYFDRLLSGLGGHRCGVAFDEQIVDRIPLEPHDAVVNSILTPSRWVELEAARG